MSVLGFSMLVAMGFTLGIFCALMILKLLLVCATVIIESFLLILFRGKHKE